MGRKRSKNELWLIVLLFLGAGEEDSYARESGKCSQGSSTQFKQLFFFLLILILSSHLFFFFQSCFGELKGNHESASESLSVIVLYSAIAIASSFLSFATYELRKNQVICISYWSRIPWRERKKKRSGKFCRKQVRQKKKNTDFSWFRFFFFFAPNKSQKPRSEQQLWLTLNAQHSIQSTRWKKKKKERLNVKNRKPPLL